jgi:polyphosphate kinase
VETLVEAHNPTVKSQILTQIMAANMADTAQSWVLAPDGTYFRDLGSPGAKLFSCHQFFMENPSLSGRGTAAKDAPRLVQGKDELAAGETAAE